MRGLKSIRQLATLITDLLSVRKVLLNRITLTIVILLLLAGGTQAYISTNNNGTISGKVVGDDGEPISNTKVVMQTVDEGTLGSKLTTETGPNGEFSFESPSGMLEFKITINGNSKEYNFQEKYHLLYKGQGQDININISSGN